jgi:hypothetical protein
MMKPNRLLLIPFEIFAIVVGGAGPFLNRTGLY